jgi:hypothetical protein
MRAARHQTLRSRESRQIRKGTLRFLQGRPADEGMESGRADVLTNQYYLRGVGEVRDVAVKGDKEEFVLVRISH